MSMPTPAEILAASTSPYKDDPAFAATIAAPFPAGSRAERKVKSLLRKVAKLKISPFGPRVDTVDHLCRALNVILHGKNLGSAALDVMVDRTNPLSPLTCTYFALRQICRAFEQLAVMEMTDESSCTAADQYPSPFDTAVGTWVRIGYAIDPRMICDGLAGLDHLVAGGSYTDPRIALADHSAQLVRGALHPLREPLEAAGTDTLLYYFGENPGEFTCKFLSRGVDTAVGEVVDDDPGGCQPDAFLGDPDHEEYACAGLGDAAARLRESALHLCPIVTNASAAPSNAREDTLDVIAAAETAND